MPKPQINLRKVVDLTPDPRNARTHSEDQVAQIAGLIDRFGWTNPIIADDLIRAGHGRHLAAIRIYDDPEAVIHMAPGREHGGLALPKGTVPVIDCSGWSEDERRAYVLADNQVAENAGWDYSVLQGELHALAAVDFDLATIGFDASIMAEIARQAGGSSGKGADPDEVPEVEAVAVTVPGDVWVMGGHRIICGSSTDADTVAAVLAGARPNVMVTDPPYGVEYDADWRNHTGDNTRTGRATGKVMNDDNADWSEAWALFSGDVAYIWHAGNKAHIVAASLINNGLEIRAQIIWSKSNMVIGRGDYHPKHEPCWYVVRKGRPGKYVGGRKQTTVWDIDKPQKSETGHSTQKPVECMRRPIENNSKPGDGIYEPFSGSGTTIIAGEMTQRRVYAVELNPAYVDLAVRRWQEFTGKEAVLERTGETFAEATADRVPADSTKADPALT